MAGPSNWLIYNDYLLNSGKKVCDLSADTLKICLVTSASVAINQAWVGANYASLLANGHELPTANGYIAGGAVVASQTWTGGGASATSNFSLGNVSWNASGAGLTVRAAVLYDSADPGQRCIAYFLLDSTPADNVTAAGQTLSLNLGTVFVESRS